jgi:predicted nucleotidyltransferase
VPDPVRTADELARALMEQGAQAVALVGSHATGTATSASDLDLAIVGEGPSYRLEVHDGILVSLGWAPVEEQRRRLYDPEMLATHVTGWRSAVLLRDPQTVGAELQRLAKEWSWDEVRAECDAWVSGWIVGLAEEAQKLVSSVRAGNDLSAAALSSYLALQLARVMAIRRRILYPSDSSLWELVAVGAEPEWRQAQRSAFGLETDTVLARAKSALRLYELAAEDASQLLDGRQRAVVAHALATSLRL